MRVVGVIVKACVLPEGVDVRRYARLLSAKSAERGEMLIGNSMRSERGGQGVAVELRIGSRARNGPHVDDELDVRSRQQRHELVDRAGGMSDGEEGIGHARGDYTSVSRVVAPPRLCRRDSRCCARMNERNSIQSYSDLSYGEPHAPVRPRRLPRLRRAAVLRRGAMGDLAADAGADRHRPQRRGRGQRHQDPLCDLRPGFAGDLPARRPRQHRLLGQPGSSRRGASHRDPDGQPRPRPHAPATRALTATT